MHLEIDPEDYPSTLQLIRIELPDPVSLAEVLSLPEQWRTDQELTRSQGDRFLEGRGALLLSVPSAIISHTTNYLFNPLHAEAKGAHLEVERFPLDLRLV